jgi:hypothetical protein
LLDEPKEIEVEQRIIGTVIDVEPRDAYACFVEIECKALEDATAFQIVSTDLPFEHVALPEAAGSRLKLICAPGLKVNPGEKVKIAVKPLERSALRRRGSEMLWDPLNKAQIRSSQGESTFLRHKSSSMLFDHFQFHRWSWGSLGWLKVALGAGSIG